MNSILLLLCGVFYAVLCVFSIVTGLMYAGGKRDLNPLELSDAILRRYADSEKRKVFAVRMGWVTFAVGIAQGIAAFAVIRAGSPIFYWIALGFTLFSIFSVACKLKGKISVFPLLKCAAYAVILIVLLSGGTRALFFGVTPERPSHTEGARIMQDGQNEGDTFFQEGGGDPMTVLCYGDSNTYGYDPRSYFGDRYPADSRWVDILSEKTGLKTINAGENGREIPRRDEEFKQFQELLAQSQADCLIVMLGGNDLLQGASPETAADRMEKFLSQIAGIEKSSIVLVGPPPKKLGAWVPDESLIQDSKELCAAYEKLAEKMGIQFVDAGEWDIELCYDGVHFTENGHKAFAEGMAVYLQNQSMYKKASNIMTSDIAKGACMVKILFVCHGRSPLPGAVRNGLR